MINYHTAFRFCLFMGAQGHEIKQNILFQYNQNAIKMEKTGRSRAQGTPENENKKFK